MAALGAAAPAGAQQRGGPIDPIIPGLHNTGVDDGNKKLNAGEPDTHFTVSGPMSGTPLVISPSNIPKEWLPRQDESLWISIANDTFGPQGTYRYDMRIDLTGFDPSSIRIDGSWAADDAGGEVLLNGGGTGNGNTIGPGEYTPFVLTHGFVSGINTITFVIPNQGSSTGFRMQLDAVTAPAARPDLSIKKTHTGDFVAGGTGVYTVVVTNSGSVASSGTVTVSDTLPAGLTPTSASGTGWNCSIAGQDVTCTRGDALTTGSSFPAISINVGVAANATSVTNTALVSVANDSNSGNNSSSDQTTITSASIDLAIAKRHDGQFQQGGSGTYSITVNNVGTAATAGQVTVRDTLPSGLTPTGASGTGWNCTPSGQTVSCNRSDPLAPGTSFLVISLTVSVSGTATTVTNTATVEGGGDSNSANNTANDETVIAPAARDLTITKSHTGDFTAGDTGRAFTIRVSNIGAVASTGSVTVRDTLPGGLSPTGATGNGWACSTAGAAVQCTRSDVLPPGAAFPDLTLTVNVADNASNVVNEATVEGGGDTVSSNNSAKDTVKIVPPAPIPTPDLTITKTHSGNATQGQTGFVFTIDVTNRGGAPTSGTVTVSDAFPAGLTPTGANGSGWGCTTAGQQVTCNRSDPLASGADYPPIAVTTTVAVNASNTENIATISGGADGDATNNTARDSVTVGPAPPANKPDLRITKTHSGAFQPGQRGSFQIEVSNVGPGPTAGEVTVADTMPAGLTPASASGGGWGCTLTAQSVSCKRSDVLSAGASWPAITLAADVLGSAQSSTNQATVSGGGEDAPGANNTASDAYVVAKPDLTITKVHTGNFLQGQTGATYTITVSNAGGAATTSTVTVSDAVPAGLTARTADGSGWDCTVQTPSVNCTRSDALAAGSSWPAITLTVDVAPDAIDLVNTATVSGGGDTSTGNNSASDATTVGRGPQVTITKQHPKPVVQGQPLAFTITVGNNGGAPTVGAVTVTDLIPAGLTNASASSVGWNCGVAGSTLTCSRSDALQPGEVYPSITLNTTVSGAPGSIVNTATVSGGGDTTPGDNTAQDAVTISTAGVPNLVIDKRHTGTFQQGQQNAAFTIVVSNAGDQATSGAVTVTDTMPAPLKPTAASGSGWNCSIAGQTVSCQRGDALAGGGSWPALTLAVNVAADAPATAVNTADVTGGGDGVPEDNRDTDEVQISSVVRGPDLVIDKSHADPFQVGQQNADYLIRIGNAGSGPTVGEVVVTDQVPAGFQPVSASGDGWTSSIAGQIVTVRRSDSLAPGASYPTIVLRVEVKPAASSATNSASVTGGGDVNQGNNVDYDSTSVGAPPDLTISLFSEGPVIAGSESEFTAETQNLGPGRSVGQVVVVTELAQSLTPIVALGSGWTCSIDGSQFRCSTTATLDPLQKLPPLRLRTAVSASPGPEVVVSGQVVPLVDANPANNRDELRAATIVPVAELAITQTLVPDIVEIGGGAVFIIGVLNTGTATVSDAVVDEVLPRGFQPVEGSVSYGSTISRSNPRATDTISGRTAAGLQWRLGSLDPGERVLLTFRALAGADAREGVHQASASVTGRGPDTNPVAAGPVLADVRVVTSTFSMEQVLVGRVFQDVDGDGSFDENDRGIIGARVIASTGQAAVTDRNGMYNLPSIGSGSVAISLDPGTIPDTLTLADDGPGGRSWSRLLRTPVGGGALLRQDFRLVISVRPSLSTPVEGRSGSPQEPEASGQPISQADRIWPDNQIDVTGGAKPPIPPRREYEDRQGPAMMIGFGEIALGSAAPEFELFEKDGDAWGFASLFYQGGLGSPRNRLTLSYDSRRNINQTSGADRLFELDPRNRRYPVMGDASTREELAQSNSKLFARLERGGSYAMFGDLIGDLPESNNSGGRLSSYSRHLTGVEGRIGGQTNFVTVRGARPTTAYERDVFSGQSSGLIALSRRNILPGTETIALEVRDRRAPERILSRRVLARNVDYRLEPISGLIDLLFESGSLDGDLNLVQLVANYEYEGSGIENMVASARGSGTFGALTIGASLFTEEPEDGQRFSVTGVDALLRLPNAGSLKVDVPYSSGQTVARLAFNNTVGASPASDDGFAVNAALEQPLGRRTVVRASYLDVGNGFTNPYAATTTPGARYGRAEVQLDPFERSRLLAGVTNERNETARVDNERNTASAFWNQKLGRGFSVAGGYDARTLDDNRAGLQTNSGLATAEARFKVARLEAMARRQENILDADDPTYPTQTELGARVALTQETSLVYSHRLSDAPIKPIGDLTGFSALDTTSEFRLGLESRLRDAVQLTSRYQIEDGINGPDAFAVIGAQNRFDLPHGLSADVGFEHGHIVEGKGSDFTSGRAGLAWLRPNTFKATARYDARDRDAYSDAISVAAAGRIVSGLTGLVRSQWLNANARGIDGRDVLAGLAVRPVGSDAAGLLFTYRFGSLTGNDLLARTLQPTENQASFSTDAYWRPVRWLEVYGKGGWQQIEQSSLRLSTDTYVIQGRLQAALARWLDVALEQRWLHQPVTDSTRNTVAAEFGVWPIADLRLGVGYNFRDTTDPYGRDRQGRPEGAYFTVSTKLAHLFDLLGSAPAAPAASP